MDLLRRWTGHGHEVETPIAWVVNGHLGDYNSRLAIAGAFASNPLTLDAEKILNDAAADEPEILVQYIDAIVEKAVEVYARSLKKIADEAGSKPNFLVTGIGLKRKIPFADIKLDLSPLISQAVKLAFGNETTVIFCNNARRTWGAIPECPYYDFLIAPAHLPKLDDPRVVECVGIPHLINENVITSGVQEWEDRLSTFRDSEHVICVLLGGNIEREKFPFTAEQAQKLGREINQFAIATNGSLLITNSHRTLPETSAAFMQEITGVPAFFHDWQKNKTDGNPYSAFLGFAHSLIVTIDSISMMFEGAFMGKELYLVQPHACVEPQHTSAAQLLIEQGFARPFDGRRQKWERPPFPNCVHILRDTIQKRMAAAQAGNHVEMAQVIQPAPDIKRQAALVRLIPNTAT